MLGDENNNDLIDLSSIDRAKCALLVIDELRRSTSSNRALSLPAIQQTAKLHDGRTRRRHARHLRQ